MNNIQEYRQTSFQFMDEFPDLKRFVRREDKELAEDGPHPFFSFVVTRIVAELLVNEAANRETLKRVFSFFERLATHTNEDIRGIVGLSVCESIASDEVVLEKYKRYAGPVTIKFCEELLK